MVASHRGFNRSVATDTLFVVRYVNDQPYTISRLLGVVGVADQQVEQDLLLGAGAWLVDNAFAAKEDAADPRINLVDRADLAGPPSARLITAQIDPLRSESISYGETLKAAGNDV